MRRTASALGFALALACSSPATPPDAAVELPDAGAADAPDPPLSIPPPGHIALVRHDDGRVDIADDAGTVYVRLARAEALVRTGTMQETLATNAGCTGSWASLTMPPNTATYFAMGEGWAFTCVRADGLGLEWRFWIDHAHDTVIADLAVTSPAGAPERTLLRLSPFVTDGPDGGLFVGGHIARHRILDDGADLARETDAFLHYPGEPRNPLANLPPITSRGFVLANWNHAITDLDGARSFVAGMLGVEVGLPTFGTNWTGVGPLDVATGRRGFDAWYADSALLFTGKPLHPMGTIRSEAIYVDPLSIDPLVGLERYADALAAWTHVTPWAQRDGGRPIPTGWNSWSGGSGRGGLGTDIDETIIEQCLAVMSREFEPFGDRYFQIDDGYMPHYGDWTANLTRFPRGLAPVAADIQADGLIPGIWIGPFLATSDSMLAAAHPDWLQDPMTAALGGIGGPNGSERALDLSNPAVLQFIATTMRSYRDDLHMGWIKLDYGYRAFLFPPHANPDVSSVEMYHDALVTAHDALGPDVFLLSIGLVGMNLGVADGMRLTLDDGPTWDEPDPFGFGNAGTMKGSVRTGSRRYYFNDRVWITHDDLLFFRTSPGSPTVTMDDALTFSTFIGLSGAIVKFGEDLRTLTPQQIDVWRRLLPVYPAGARPMDLFTRNYPEQYRLPIDGTLAGSHARWTVIGITNWGSNEDFTSAVRATPMPDADRTYAIDLARFGLDGTRDYLAQEFWSETFVGVVHGSMMRTVPAHGREVLALRERTGSPQFLGHNRHFTQGGTDLVSETWDAASSTLHVVLNVDAGSATAVPFEYRVFVYGAGMSATTGTMGDATVTQSGEVVTYRFTPTTPGVRDIAITFH